MGEKNITSLYEYYIIFDRFGMTNKSKIHKIINYTNVYNMVYNIQNGAVNNESYIYSIFVVQKIEFKVKKTNF